MLVSQLIYILNCTFTLITIAHRLSIVKNADTIYVLDGGKIVEQGSHDELENHDGHYNQFIKNQLI